MPIKEVRPISKHSRHLTLEMQNKNCSRRNFIYIFYFYVSKKIGFDVSCNSCVQQRIHMKYQVLFSLKNNEKALRMPSDAVVIGALRANIYI